MFQNISPLVQWPIFAQSGGCDSALPLPSQLLHPKRLPARHLGAETSCLPTTEQDVSKGSAFLVSREREAKMDKYLLRTLLKWRVSVGILRWQVTKSANLSKTGRALSHWVVWKSVWGPGEDSRQLQPSNHLFKVTSLEQVNPHVFSVCISLYSRLKIPEAEVLIYQTLSTCSGSNWVGERKAGAGGACQGLWVAPLWPLVGSKTFDLKSLKPKCSRGQINSPKYARAGVGKRGMNTGQPQEHVDKCGSRFVDPRSPLDFSRLWKTFFSK